MMRDHGFDFSQERLVLFALFDNPIKPLDPMYSWKCSTDLIFKAGTSKQIAMVTPMDLVGIIPLGGGRFVLI